MDRIIQALGKEATRVHKVAYRLLLYHGIYISFTIYKSNLSYSIVPVVYNYTNKYLFPNLPFPEFNGKSNENAVK